MWQFSPLSVCLMPVAYHHRTIQVAVALYAIVVIPGYGWHLVPGCGHDHCSESQESDGPHTHCGHSHHGDHCQHAAKNVPANESEQAPEKGVNVRSPVDRLYGCHDCGICQFLAKAQVRTVLVEDLSRSQLTEEPLPTIESLAGIDVVTSYSARAPPSGRDSPD